MHRHVQRNATDDPFLKIVPDRSAYILLMMWVGGWPLIIATLCVLFVGGWQAYKFLILSISIELVCLLIYGEILLF